MTKKRNQNNALKREFDKGRKTISMHCTIDEYSDLLFQKNQSGLEWLEILKLGLRVGINKAAWARDKKLKAARKGK